MLTSRSLQGSVLRLLPLSKLSAHLSIHQELKLNLVATACGHGIPKVLYFAKGLFSCVGLLALFLI